jgi:lysophospholipase L1-like esterase
VKIEKGSKLVMIGDSITDADRARPVGEGLFGAHGKGYVSLVDALLSSVYPAHGIRVVNQGVSGNTVRDLKCRWKTDVLDLKPDWISIMIGINDDWRQFDLPRQAEIHVYPEEYEATLEELITQTLPSLKGLVLMTPYFIEPNKSDPMRIRMDCYGSIVKKLAGKHGCVLVDTQAAFDAVLPHYHPMSLAWDRIHPIITGHMILARAFMNGIGCPG